MTDLDALPEDLYRRIRPDDFFEVRVREPSENAGMLGLLGLCTNYEGGRWRAAELADLLFDYLPEFALEYSELKGFHAGTGRRQLRRAARTMYASDKFQRRGEFGELLLHAVCREIYNSSPAISKIFFKDSVNETVHGFDSVHIVELETGLELLVGEVKFYSEIGAAMNAVAAELEAHLEPDYLRDECMLIINRLDDAWPHSEALRRLIREQQTLDRIFHAMRVPVLLTYDSDCVGRHDCEDPPYPDEFASEVRTLCERFAARDLPTKVIVDLILVPLKSKADLVVELDRKLRIHQAI